MTKLLVIGGLFGLTSVMMGAYIDHGLATTLSAKALHSITTAQRYQQFYALMITVMALIKTNRVIIFANIAFIIGVLLFCFGIYAGILLNMDELMRVAPLGGFTLMLGWALLIVAAFRRS